MKREEEELRGQLSARIDLCCRRMRADENIVASYQTATSGEAVALAAMNLLCETIDFTRQDDPQEAAEMFGAIRERLALLGRDADRAAKIAYPDQFAETA